MPARFNFFGSDHFHYGTVGNLLGHSAASAGYAITPCRADARGLSCAPCRCPISAPSRIAPSAGAAPSSSAAGALSGT